MKSATGGQIVPGGTLGDIIAGKSGTPAPRQPRLNMAPLCGAFFREQQMIEIAIGVAARSAGRATHVFLLAGQSNMVGRAPFDGGAPHPAGTREVGRLAVTGTTGSAVTTDGQIVAARTMLDHQDPGAGDMGLSIAFAIAYAAANPDVPLVFVPCAKGGTGFWDNQWNPGNPLFSDAVARTNALLAANPSFVLKGILWHQGERDSDTSAHAAAYQANLDTMILALRAAIAGAANVPFVCGTIIGGSATVTTVNAALSAITDRFDYAACAAGNGLADKGDGLHFSAASLRTLGARYFAAWQAAAADAPPVTAPKKVTGLALAPGVGQFAASWTAPANGGAAITDYLVEVSADGGATWTAFADGVSSAPGATVDGLGNGAARSVRVSAVNAAGTGPASAAATATTFDLPGQVTGLALSASAGAIAASWSAPATGGAAIADYLVEVRQGAGAWSVFADGTSAATAATLTGLAPGTAYGVRVSAVNAVGTGLPSAEATATTSGGATVPGQPTGLALTPGVGQIAAAWTAPGNGGAALTDYLVEVSADGGATWSGYPDGVSTATSATIAGLGNGATRSVRVSAVNAVGTGAASTAAAATTPDVPGQVGGLALSASTTAIAASWSAPATGGAAIADYLVEVRQGAGAWSVFADGILAATSATITGLAPGTTYGVRVSAINAVGTGPASTEATATTGVGASAPGQPTGLALTPGIGQIAAAWTAPGNGGSALTDYLVEVSADGGASWTVYPDGTSTAASATIAGLGNGATRAVRVSATNAVGTGPVSAAATATTPDVPGQVAAPALTPATTSIGATWSAPAANGTAITDYVVEVRQGAGAWSVFADGVAAATSATVTGLSPGTAYGVRVSAVNAVGTGATSPEATATTGTGAAVPGQVTGLSLTPGVGQIGLAWTAPATGGSAITDYVVEVSTNGGSSWSTYADGVSTTTSATITGLGNGATRAVRVSAVNAIGTGTASAASSATTPTVPGQVTGLAVVPDDGRNDLTWAAPASNGGATITDYVLEVSTDAGATFATIADGVSTATAFAHTGLANGTTYAYRVAAVNAAGTGTASATASGTPGARIVKAFSHGESAASATSYSFASLAVTAGSVVVVTTSRASGAHTVTALSVGGVSATKLASTTDGSQHSSVWLATGVTGTSATVAVTCSVAPARMGVAAWSVGSVAAGKFSVAQTAVPLSPNTGLSFKEETIAAVAGGLVLAHTNLVLSGQNPQVAAWSGAAERLAATQVSAGYNQAAADAAVAATGSLTVRATFAAGYNYPYMSLVHVAP